MQLLHGQTQINAQYRTYNADGQLFHQSGTEKMSKLPAKNLALQRDQGQRGS